MTRHKFAHLLHWHYKLYGIQKYNFRVVPSGVTPVKICPPIIELSIKADRQGQPYMFI
jgi:hypothetical protein